MVQIQNGCVGDEPLVSVIIPTYKRASRLRSSVECVLRQTYQNLEILVVDDGSPDDTASVVEMIPDRRVRYIRHEMNKGVSAARNTGIRASMGSYIAFMDDDDDWREDKIQRQVLALNRYDAVACLGIADGYPTREHNSPCIRPNDLKAGTFLPSSLIAKAHVFRDIMFDEDLTQGEDWDVFIRIAQRYSIGWDSEPLLVYNGGSHERATNTARLQSTLDLEKRTAVLYKHREFFGEKWFKYHMAGTLLSYIGTRRNRLQSIAYALSRCGMRSVAAVLTNKIRHKLLRTKWFGRYGIRTNA